MSDLEQRLAEALARGAEHAPGAAGLAESARARARRKRRVRIGAVAVVAVLCVAVPTAVVAARGSEDRGGPPHVATDGADHLGVPPGQRVESWRSVTILVPDSWGWGSLASWCAAGGSLTPRVQRPEGVAPAIGCTPGSTYGISFQAIDNHDDFEWPVVQQDPKSGYPPGAYVGARGIGGVLVTVTAPTQAEGLDVLATMRPIGREGDPNGCATDGYSPPRRPAQGAVSVCRYDAKGQLEQSELLTGADAQQAVQAVNAATEPVACGDRLRGPATVRLRWASGSALVYLDGCAALTHGDRPTTTYALTPDLLSWALSPGWSGSVPEGVSLPSKLRQH
jgi:hypothetical protein